jgi:hypothetical protein
MLGMTRLILILTYGRFTLQVQHVVPEVTISPEFTSENVTTYIVDSGGKFPESTPSSFPRA